MAVFEVELGLWRDALARFVEHILPAVSTGDALTAAPALLWRLELASPAYQKLPWEEVRQAVGKGLGGSGAYVELHHLLALAGAGDASGLDAWLMSHGDHVLSAPDDILVRWAMGLRAFVARDWELAAKLLGPDTPSIRRLGGSRAQNLLFERIWKEAWRRADRARPGPGPSPSASR